MRDVFKDEKLLRRRRVEDFFKTCLEDVSRHLEDQQMFAGIFTDLMIRGFELVTRALEPVTCVFELVTHEFELVTRGFELATRGFELVDLNFHF